MELLPVPPMVKHGQLVHDVGLQAEIERREIAHRRGENEPFAERIDAVSGNERRREQQLRESLDAVPRSQRGERFKDSFEHRKTYVFCYGVLGLRRSRLPRAGRLPHLVVCRKFSGKTIGECTLCLHQMKRGTVCPAPFPVSGQRIRCRQARLLMAQARDDPLARL